MRTVEQFARVAATAITLSVLGLGFLISDVRVEADDHPPLQPWSLDQSAVSGQLKAFIAAKEAQARALAKAEGKELPPEYATFFATVAKGDSQSVSNIYERLLPGAEWQPALETHGALEEFAAGNDKYAIAFGQGIINSIPQGSIYFGGTAPGRFLVTALSKSHINADPFFTLTQNWLGDNSYLDYVRAMYGSRIAIPTTSDVQRCYQEYAEDVQSRRNRGEKLAPDEGVTTTTNGGLLSTGMQARLDAEGRISRLIFDKNPNREFYVEESHVINWMYPNLEPHRLILKLNRRPPDQLDPLVVAHDREFWDGLAKQLLADRGFLANSWARRTYSKHRSAIGGVYAYRRITNEAEYAYQQAIALDPTCPEGIFRLTQLYTEQNRFDDAIATIKSLQQFDPTNQKIQDAITQLQTMKQSASRSAGKSP
ncbi:MAG: tetratricopeptide repeat protein [Verrucomicrobiia bacterium]|jgi:tetratricopeptide (TPR) repeat protein